MRKSLDPRIVASIGRTLYARLDRGGYRRERRWRTLEGKELRLVDMTKKHIVNCIVHIEGIREFLKLNRPLYQLSDDRAVEILDGMAREYGDKLKEFKQELGWRKAALTRAKRKKVITNWQHHHGDSSG